MKLMPRALLSTSLAAALPALVLAGLSAPSAGQQVPKDVAAPGQGVQKSFGDEAVDPSGLAPSGAPLSGKPGRSLAPGQPGARPGSAPSGAPALEPPPEPPAVPAYAGSYREGMQEILDLARSGMAGEALGVSQALLSKHAEAPFAEPQLSELLYASGVLTDRLELSALATDAFGKASVLAGPGELRLDSLYNRGTVQIHEGERLFEQIPEIAGGGTAGGVGGLQRNAPQAGEEQEDTLPLARAAFHRARETLLTRLRLDWADPDVRANLEFIQRRLKEIERIEENRKSEEEREDEESDEEEEQTDESQEGESQEGNEKAEGEDEGGSGEDQAEDETREPEEQEQDPDQEDPNTGDNTGGEEEEDKPEPSQDEEGDPSQSEQEEPTEEQMEAPSEQHLSREEVTRLLDKLAELDEEARELQEALTISRRVPVERDW